MSVDSTVSECAGLASTCWFELSFCWSEDDIFEMMDMKLKEKLPRDDILLLNCWNKLNDKMWINLVVRENPVKTKRRKREEKKSNFEN